MVTNRLVKCLEMELQTVLCCKIVSWSILTMTVFSIISHQEFLYVFLFIIFHYFLGPTIKKSTASLESKALLQNKLNKLSSSKVDSAKYKLHMPSISLPSSSKVFDHSPEVKEEVKLEANTSPRLEKSCFFLYIVILNPPCTY